MINYSDWKKIKLSTLFEFLLSSGDNQENKLLEGDIPLISAGKFQNGIVKYVETGDGEAELFNGNMITVDMFGQAFYQPIPFYSVSHGRVNILKPLFELNEKRGLFIATVLTKILSEKYAINDMCSQKALLNEYIYLPVDKDGKPDFVYMEQYIDCIYLAIEKKNNAIVGLTQKQSNIKIDTSKWKEFTILEVFGMPEKPASRSFDSYNDGDIPFVSSGNDNNGVKGYVAKKNEELDKGNCITVSAVDGSTFYQPVDFLGRGGGGSSINILRNEKLNKYVGLFLASVIGKQCQKYKFADMCSAKYLIKEKIKLPVNDDGEIDYKFMEDYMRKIEHEMVAESEKLFNVFR